MSPADQSLMVSALIVTRDKDGRYEILNVLARNKTKYGFSGGKLEAGETPEQAVIRETQEELGVTPTNIRFIGVFESLTPEGRAIKMHVFSGNVSQDIAPAGEIAQLHWLTYDQMNGSKELLTPMTIDHVLPLLKSRTI